MNDKHKTNADVRPQAQNIKNEKGAYAKTPDTPRNFKTAFSPEFLKPYHQGVMRYTYRGVSCLKSPIDLALYMKLLYETRPATIIEIGSFHGGAALFYADITEAYGLDTEIITVDFRDIQHRPGDQRHPRVEFVQADALDLANSNLHTRLESARHPWFIIEDSAHTFQVSYAVMEYFAPRMKAGEYMIIEDGVIEDQGANWRYDGGPNRAVHQFFLDHPETYEVDTDTNDWFGTNCSFNPNGYLRRTASPWKR